MRFRMRCCQLGLESLFLSSILLVCTISSNSAGAEQNSDIKQRSIDNITRAAELYGEQSEQYRFALVGLLYTYDIAGLTKESIPFAEKYQDYLIAKKGPLDQELQNNQQDLVRRYSLLNDYRGAAASEQKHLQRLVSAGGAKATDLVDTQHRLALLYGMTGDYQEASKRYSELLPQLESTYGLGHRNVIIALDGWARLAEKAGNKIQAKMLKQRSQALVQQGLSKDFPRKEFVDDNVESALISDIDSAVRLHGLISQNTVQALVKLGTHYEHAGRARDAVRLARQALDLLDFLISPQNETFADFLLDLSQKHVSLNEAADALYIFSRYRDLLPLVDGIDPIKRVLADSDYAMLLTTNGRNDEAIALFNDTVPKLEENYGATHIHVAKALSFFGKAYTQAGHMDQAIAVAERDLKLMHLIKNVPIEDRLRILTNLRGIYFAAGHYSEAVAIAEETLKGAKSAYGEDDPRIAGEYNDLAIYYEKAGRIDLALKSAEKSFGLTKKAYGNDHPNVAKVLNTMANIHSALGHTNIAYAYQKQSLESTIQNFGQESIEVARSLVNTGLTEYQRGESSKSLETLEKGVILLEKLLADELELATAYQNLALLRLLNDLSFSQFSTPYSFLAFSDPEPPIQKALEIHVKKLPDDHPDLFASRVAVGAIQFFTGNPKQSIETLQDALVRLRSASGSEKNESFAQMILCISYAYIKQNELSILWGKAAVNSLQKLHLNRKDMGEPLQILLREQDRQTYEWVATLLVNQGRIAEAQQILQMLKEYEFNENLRGINDASRYSTIELTGLERAKFAPYYRLREKQAALAVERRALEAKRANQNLTSAEMERLYEITRSLMPVADKAMRVFLKQLEIEIAAIAPDVGQNSDSLVSEVTNLRKAVNSLAVSEPQAGAVGIQYLISKDRLSIILTVPGAPPIAYQKPIDRRQLYRDIRAVTEQIKNPDADFKIYAPRLKELYGLLIGPVESDLKRVGARTLMLSLDDRLLLLPFTALLSPQSHYLIQDYAVVLYNEASGQDLLHKGAATWKIAAMGLSDSVDGLPALRYVPTELEGIISVPGIAGKVYLNSKFSRARYESVLTRQSGYNVLHVASHFKFQQGVPEESYLYLGDKTKLSLADIARSQYDLSPFDLVTFSACETAKRGGRESSGNEMESLSTLTQQQGAQAVLATLWKVSDKSAGDFMRHFYSQLVKKNKADAIRATQVAMIEKRLVAKGKQDWSAPFHWAPFVAMGNWR